MKNKKIKKLIPQQKQQFNINTQLLKGVLKKSIEQNKYTF